MGASSQQEETISESSKRGQRSVRRGKNSEREIAWLLSELTGLTIKRRVRQHKGDSDLEGIPGWSVEVKRAAIAKVTKWWEQTVSQALANADNPWPVLFYRIDRRQWRAVWPLSILLGAVEAPERWYDFGFTVESSLTAWATVFRETQPTNQPTNQPQLQRDEK